MNDSQGYFVYDKTHDFYVVPFLVSKDGSTSPKIV